MHYLILLLICTFNAYGLSPLEALYKENDCGNSNYNFSHNKIAVVDSGFDGEHSLLKNNLKQGWNVVNGTRNTSAESKNIPDYAHGTLVASIISQLVSAQTHIIPFKVAPQHMDIYNLAKSLKMISEIKEISLVNISWNICQISGFAADMMRDAIKNLAYKGKMIIASAGNKSSLLAGTYLDKLLQDQKIKDHFICVGANDNTSNITVKADFSNISGKELSNVFLWAPGVSIVSAFPQNQRGYCSGTSMAAPMVTGALAKLMEEFNISNVKAREVLFKTATKINPQKRGITYPGAGDMNFAAARQYLIEENIKKLLKPVVTTVTRPAVLPIKPISARLSKSLVVNNNRQRQPITRQNTAVRSRIVTSRRPVARQNIAVRSRVVTSRRPVARQNTAVRSRVVTSRRPAARQNT